MPSSSSLLLTAYKDLVKHGKLLPNITQDRLLEKLLHIEDSCTPINNLLRRPPRGLYIYGSLGTGKTLLMDLYFRTSCLHPKMRIHFGDFVSRLLQESERERIFASRLLCLDEFQVEEIGDAMLLGDALQRIFQRQLLVMTSNRHPQELMRGRAGAEQFQPCIDLLLARMDLFDLSNPRDYRKDLRQSTEEKEVIAKDALRVQWKSLHTCSIRDFISLSQKAATQGVVLEGTSLPFQGLEDARRFINLVDVLYERRVPLWIPSLNGKSGIDESVFLPAVLEQLPMACQRTLSRLHELLLF